MFGTTLLDRRGKPERITDHAWRQLLDAAGSAGDGARDAARTARRNGSGLAEDATELVGSAAGEARRRATLAFDALAGRRPALPWALLVGAALVGAAIGWAAGTAARAAGSRLSDVEEIEFVDVDRPNSPADRDG
ncbi:hypothetical protein [Micromonospora narathiwatensis]|uniref:Uncharacterized protein n=1 Tax=Micromonospora narathiwatensis TaxID=299146 RepID=A0A1A8ZZ20_9ACTN|nr:hypothetical protein [Micromonospora narathiwatensis]SBT49135.1 hypothetical protein GA0070621_3361 [Micromonospora narathiwatensis]